MRRRTTFVHDARQQFSPGELLVTDSQLVHGGLDAAREERLTYSFDELPDELQQVLSHAHELHVRWSPEHQYRPATPFLSRISPGLHVFYTPLQNHPDELVCPWLKKVLSLELKCQSLNATFSTPPLLSERFAASSAFQYYSLLPSLQQFVAYLQRNICPRSDLTCSHSVSLLNIADHLDLDYDSISHALSITAFWSKPPAVHYDPLDETVIHGRWKVDIQQQSEKDRVEIGILSSNQATDPHDLQLSGFLTVLGEDKQAKPTLFHFPARHHTLPASQASKQQYRVSIKQPQGLHPILQIAFENRAAMLPPENRPKDSYCSLQSYLVLPSYLFADEYAFKSEDPLFAQSHNIRETRAISGETDLEAPDYVVSKWGSTILLELALPSHTNGTSSDQTSWDVTLPLHLRYMEPKPDGQQRVDIPWPIVYWACTAEEGTKFPVNPFDRVNLGFEGLYGPRTMFYHLPPNPKNGSRLIESLSVPVYNNDSISARSVEMGTLFIIIAGFLWIFLKLWPGIKRELRAVADTTQAGMETKKSR